MNCPTPIVFVLGVEGNLYTAEALRAEFDRPVIGIISSERIHEIMTPERRAIFDRLYSLPDFFFDNIDQIRALPRSELDRRQHRLEERLGIKNSAALTNRDRRIRRMGDYRKVRDWQLCNLMFIERFLAEVNPAFVLDGVITYLQLALRTACEARNTPYLLSMASRSNSYAFYHTDGQQIGMERLFADFQENNFDHVPHDRIADADQAYKSFIEKPRRPAYAEHNALTRFNWPVIKHKLSLAFNKGKLLPSSRVKALDIQMNAEMAFSDIVLNFFRTRCRRNLIKTMRIFNKHPDITAPYVYVPLHYSPEISDLFFGTEYDHHESFIAHLSKYVPSDTQLFVKEHTSMIGRRPISFYRNLQRLYNVQLIDPRVDTFELIKRADATITVTGTPGWEAFLLGKPAVAFGNVFYNRIPGILHPSLDEDLDEVLNNYICDFKPDYKTIRNAFRAYYLTTYEGPKVDLAYTSNKDNAREHASLFARDLNHVITNWHAEMQGTFPDDVINTPQQKQLRHAAYA